MDTPTLPTDHYTGIYVQMPQETQIIKITTV